MTLLLVWQDNIFGILTNIFPCISSHLSLLVFMPTPQAAGLICTYCVERREAGKVHSKETIRQPLEFVLGFGFF